MRINDNTELFLETVMVLFIGTLGYGFLLKEVWNAILTEIGFPVIGFYHGVGLVLVGGCLTGMGQLFFVPQVFNIREKLYKLLKK